MLVARTFSLGVHCTPLSVEKFMAFKMYSALHIHSSQTQRFPSGSPNNNSRQLKSWDAFCGPDQKLSPTELGRRILLHGTEALVAGEQKTGEPSLVADR